MLLLRLVFGGLALITGRSAYAEGVADVRGVACAAELLTRVINPRARPTWPPAFFKPHPARAKPGAFVGARALTIRADGTWMWVPVNAPFALDTYTSRFELQAWVDQGESIDFILTRLRLPLRLALELNETRYARELARRLAGRLHARGRRLVCFGEGGRADQPDYLESETELPIR